MKSRTRRTSGRKDGAYRALLPAALVLVLVAPATTRDAAGADAWLYKAEAGPHPVASDGSIVLADRTRGKDLQIRVTWPEAPGPFPVIVWCHGATGTKDMYGPIVKHWAGHGYVCIQANHSDSRAFGEKGEREVFRDWASRPKDVSFLFDSLDEIEGKIEGLEGKMDREVLGVGGHSFGAHTAQLVGGVTTVDPFTRARKSHADPRPLAFLLLSPQGKGAMLDEDSWKPLTRPAMTVTGSKDPGRKGQPYTWRLDPFRHAPPEDKYLVFIEGARHGFGGVVGEGEFRNAGPPDPDHVLYVKTATTAFWDAYLLKSETARAFLDAKTLEQRSEGEAKITSGEAEAAREGRYAPGPGTLTAVFEDAVWTDGRRDRAVPVRIYAPDPKHGDGPFPVVVFSHGGGESRKAYGYLGRPWARNGYAVVFVTHKGNDAEAVREGGMKALGRADFAVRPADMRFVIDRLLSPELAHPLLRGRIDTERIAAAGQCAGSTTVFALAGLTSRDPQGNLKTYRDERIRATVALSPQVGSTRARARQESLHEDSWSTVEGPVLVMTGLEDFNWIPEARANPGVVRKPYDGMPPGDKFLVEIEGAEHNAFTDSVPYYPAGERDPRHHGWIAQATTAFLDAYLRGMEEARAWLENERLEKETAGECRQEHKHTEEDVGPDASAGNEGEEEEDEVDEEIRRRAERMMRFLDRDRDGSLSRREMPQRLVRAFDRLDADRDGRLDEEELARGLSKLQGRRGASGAGRSGEEGESGGAQGDPPPAPSREADAGPFETGCVERVLLRDESRNVAIPCRVWFPRGEGPFPVIVHCLAAGASAKQYDGLASFWAGHGYVVLLPDHADSPDAGEGQERANAVSNWESRPLDARLALDRLDAIEEANPALEGRLDRGRIGAGGHYVGSLAGGLLTGMRPFPGAAGRDYADARVKAALMISPVGRGQGLTEETWAGMKRPLMVLTGSRDLSARTQNPPQWRTEPFRFSPPGDKYLAWVQDLGPTRGARGTLGEGGIWPAPVEEVVRLATLAFWDAYLKEDEDAFAHLQEALLSGSKGGSARITAKHREGEGSREETPPGSPPAMDFDAAAAYSESCGGVAVLVAVDGEIVFERYASGHAPGTAVHLHSATKGFWGTAIAAMIEDGLIESFDEPAAKTLPEWSDDPRKSRITLRHLLGLNAGLVQDVVRLQGHDRPTLASDLFRHAVGVRAARPPGTVFQYGPSCYYVLGEIMKRNLAERDETPLDYLKRRILDPIGVEIGAWVHDASGNPHIPNGAHLTARDWMKYGQWLVQGGVWEGRRIVREDLLRALVEPTEANPGHGLALWLNRPGGHGVLPSQRAPDGSPGGWIHPEGYPDLFGALGAGKNRMYMIPSAKTVVLRQSNRDRDTFSDAEFLRILLVGKGGG